MKISCRAKINLFLNVLYRRADGFHELDTVFQSVELSDELFLEKKISAGLELSVSDPDLPCGSENLVWKAYDLLAKQFASKVGGVTAHLEKYIPHGAGLGGGSADAAGMLMGINRLYSLNLQKKQLLKLAEELGSDVPFCLMGGTARGRGRGEILEPITGNPDFEIIIVHPGFGISTKEAYGELTLEKDCRNRKPESLLYALKVNNIVALCSGMYNCFQVVVEKKHPGIREIRAVLLKSGCQAALMSGSGSAVCGFAPFGTGLEKIALDLKKNYPFVAYTRPAGSGVVLY